MLVNRYLLKGRGLPDTCYQNLSTAMEKDDLLPLLWGTKPDFDAIRGGRVRVTLNCGGSRPGDNLKLFREQMDALVPIQNIVNNGSCDITLAALDANMAELNSVTIRPKERVAVFLPDSNAVGIVVSCPGDGCQGKGILECDDIPRV